MRNFEQVYETMLGLLEPEAEAAGVENAFSDGSICTQEYEKMRDAYDRLCSRLGAANEDTDLNTMVDSLETIQKELCRRFYSMTALSP